MPPQTPQEVDVAQLLRARQAQGLDLTPDQLRLLEETATPQEQADLFAPLQAEIDPSLLQPQASPEVAFLPQLNAQVQREQEGEGTSLVDRFLPNPRALADTTIGRLLPEPEPRPTEESTIPPASVEGGAAPVNAPFDFMEGLPRDAQGEILPPSTQAGGTLGSENMGFDPATLAFTVDVPGVEGGSPGFQISIPPEIATNNDALGAWLEAAAARSRAQGNIITGGPNPSIPGSVGERILLQARSELARQAALGPQQPVGPREPRLDLSTRLSQTIPGQADPATLARLGLAGQVRAAAQGAHDIGLQQTAQARAGALGQIAEEQEAQSQALAEEAEARNRQMQAAISSFQEASQRVAEQRVDPQQFFGGFGGRAGAAIAVALGTIGSALGGGPNAALGIINQAIDRNIRSQEFNIQNERAGVAAQGQALNMMRQAFSDEAAANQATRALHLQAMTTRLDGMMQGLSGDQLLRAQTLRNALAQEQQLAAQAAAERQANTRTVREDFRIRGPQSRVMAQRAALMPRQQTAAQAPPQLSQQQRQRLEEQTAGLVAARGIEADTPETLEEVGNIRLSDLGREAQSLWQRAQQARLQGNRRGARAVERAVERRVATEASRRARRQTTRIPDFDPDAWNSSVDRFREGVARAPQPRPGFIRMRTEGAEGLYERALESPATFQAMNAAMNDIELWDRLVPLIIEANELEGAEVTNASALMAKARAARNMLLDAYQVDVTGTAATDDQMARIIAQMPDPGAVNVENALGLWHSVRNQWESLYFTRMINGRSILSGYGLTTDSWVSQNVQAAQRLRQRFHSQSVPASPAEAQE